MSARALRAERVSGTPQVAKSGFIDLLGQALLEQTRRLVRRGLLQEYVMQEDRLSTPRGRIDLRSVASASASTSVLCRFESLTADHPLHHVVKAGLRMAAGLVTDPLLRLDLGRAAERFFPDVTTDRVSRANVDAASSELTRRTRGYRSVLALIKILHEGQSVETEEESARVSVPSFLLDMNRLFERFLEQELARRMVPPFRVARQSQDHGVYQWQANPFSRRAPVIRPDLLFSRRGRTIAVADAKYKDYDQRAISTSDLFQVTTYAYACGVFETVPALVLYPTLRGEIVAGGVLHFAGLRGRSPARVALIGIPIARIVEDAAFDLWDALQPHLPGARVGA